GARPARLRLLQPQRAREQGGRLLDLPRARGPDAARLAGALASDGVVPGLPPPPRALRAAARGGLQHRVRAARGPGPAGEGAGEAVRHPPPPPVLPLPPMSAPETPLVPVDFLGVRGRGPGARRRFWKSLDELASSPAFRELVHREFPEQASQF